MRANDDATRRAGWITGRSRLATLADVCIRRSAVGVDTSRALGVARGWLNRFEALPADERIRCGLIVVAAALVGHIVLAALLPASARPTVSVTALALLGAGLAAAVSAK